MMKSTIVTLNRLS